MIGQPPGSHLSNHSIFWYNPALFCETDTGSKQKAWPDSMLLVGQQYATSSTLLAHCYLGQTPHTLLLCWIVIYRLLRFSNGTLFSHYRRFRASWQDSWHHRWRWRSHRSQLLLTRALKRINDCWWVPEYVLVSTHKVVNSFGSRTLLLGPQVVRLQVNTRRAGSWFLPGGLTACLRACARFIHGTTLWLSLTYCAGPSGQDARPGGQDDAPTHLARRHGSLFEVRWPSY